MNVSSSIPIDQKDCHHIYDSEKIEAFQDCPRKFFFQYVLGWKSETTNIYDVFNDAWRKAISLYHTRGMTDSHAQKACSIFEEVFQEKCPSSLRNKHPVVDTESAREGLKEYAKHSRVLDDFEVLLSKTAGKVSIGDNRVLYFKCDLILRSSKGQIWELEHKTTSRGGSAWKNRWGLDFQTNAQSYAVSGLFAEKQEDVEGMKIDGTIFPADSNIEFIRIPCSKSPDQLRLWQQECNYWIDTIEQNWNMLNETKREDDTMFAFPRNPTSCTKTGCRFDDMCEHWYNPLRHCENPPIGYKEDHHDPRDKEATANNVVSVE